SGCFFFSSRRRHTRFSRDWSSDVCSSDLIPAQTYYVDCMNGDDGRTATQAKNRATPWRTIRKALTFTDPDDTVQVLPGVCTEGRSERASCRERVERAAGAVAGGRKRRRGM